MAGKTNIFEKLFINTILPPDLRVGNERYVAEQVEVTSTCLKLSKRGKVLSILGEVLTPVGLIAVLLFFGLYPTVLTILAPWVVAVIGLILYDRGEALQAAANERLANFYREKMMKIDAALIESKIKEHGYESKSNGCL